MLLLDCFVFKYLIVLFFKYFGVRGKRKHKVKIHILLQVLYCLSTNQRVKRDVINGQ